MATCPLCSERAGKRYCPAKEAQICAVCCGTKREVEIDCPSACPYLKASRSYASESRISDDEARSRSHKFDSHFVERNHQIMDLVCVAVVEERANSPWLVDTDVIEVYKALSATLKTLSGGIYYESLPDGPIRLSLFRRTKAMLDELMEPDPAGEPPGLKVSDAVDVLDFLTLGAEASSSIRPRSRRYLDWVSEMFRRNPQTQQSSGLIIP